MSYESVSAGLLARIATVTAVKSNLAYEPTSVQASPLVFSQLDGFERQIEGSLARWTWRTRHTLCIVWQNPAACEALLRQLAVSIPLAVEADPQLGGIVLHADIVSGDAGYMEIGGTTYRTLELFSEAVELTAYTGM